jgi:transcriptional regulator GlxA family with amidase domain
MPLMSSSRHLVAVAVTDRAPIFELAIPCEVFGVERTDLADPWYDFRLCASATVATAAGLILAPAYDMSVVADEADTVIVTAMERPFQLDPPGDLVEALRAAYARGARIAGICSGAYAMAAAGLLDDRPATTHWMYADDFAARFPAVKLDPDVLYIDDGRILTSAGTGAGIDLCLHLIALDHGAAVANMVARRMVVPPHRLGGQAQYVVSPSSGPIPAPTINAVLDWARSHLDLPLTVADLAQQAVLSPRTFARRFAEATGTSPLQWLKTERVRLAQQLLETTDEPVERIAQRTGFGTAANLRQHFGRATSVSPQAYRRVFRSRG